MISQLFPQDIVTYELDPRICDGKLFPEEEEYIRGAVLKRRREFTAGRTCARAALAKKGVIGQPILVDANRAPLWPEGTIGSISHTDIWCVAAVARQRDVLSVGLDIERVNAMDENISRYVCTDMEAARMRLHVAEDRLSIATIIFSAKECLYKCLNPLVKQWIDFHDVHILVQSKHHVFLAILNRDIGKFRTGEILEGKYAVMHGHVCTSMVLQNDGFC